jgi:hypothetical protein
VALKEEGTAKQSAQENIWTELGNVSLGISQIRLRMRRRMVLVLPSTHCSRVSVSSHSLTKARPIFDEQLGIYTATAFLLSPAMHCTKIHYEFV